MPTNILTTTDSTANTHEAEVAMLKLATFLQKKIGMVWSKIYQEPEEYYNDDRNLKVAYNRAVKWVSENDMPAGLVAEAFKKTMGEAYGLLMNCGGRELAPGAPGEDMGMRPINSELFPWFKRGERRQVSVQVGPLGDEMDCLLELSHREGWAVASDWRGEDGPLIRDTDCEHDCHEDQELDDECEAEHYRYHHNDLAYEVINAEKLLKTPAEHELVRQFLLKGIKAAKAELKRVDHEM